MPGVMVRDLQRSGAERLLNSGQRQGVGRRALISTAAAMLTLLGAGPAIVSPGRAEEGGAPIQLTTVSVPPGSLDKGLIALGQQTKLKLLYPTKLTVGKKTSGVAGR